MTKLLERAFAAVAVLPEEAQDEAASMLLRFAGVEQPPEEHADLARAEAEAARGEFATDEEIRAMWAKYGR